MTLNAKLFHKEASIQPYVAVTNSINAAFVGDLSLKLPSNLINLDDFNLSILSSANVSFPGIDLQSGTLTVNITELNLGSFLNDIIKTLTNSSNNIIKVEIPKEIKNILKDYNGTTIQLDGLNVTESVYEENLSDQYMKLIRLNKHNSTKLSEYLLNPNHYKDYRLGAYVFNDNIPVNLNVDWVWVKKYKQLFLKILVALNIITQQQSENKLVSEIIIRALPDKAINYDISIPSKYTIMHNSTSPHGVR